MTVRRNQPARNPREGVLQNLKKERKKERGKGLKRFTLLHICEKLFFKNAIIESRGVRLCGSTLHRLESH